MNFITIVSKIKFFLCLNDWKNYKIPGTNSRAWHKNEFPIIYLGNYGIIITTDKEEYHMPMNENLYYTLIGYMICKGFLPIDFKRNE